MSDDVELLRLLAERDRARAALDRAEAALDRHHANRFLRASYQDELTGALQRGPGRDRIAHEVERARREGKPLSVAFLDVDGLKSVNDHAGHAEGDALLRAVGQALLIGLRSYDTVVRYGGDEFVCVLPGATCAEAQARIADVAELLRSARPGDSFSVGLAELAPDEAPDDVVRRADLALYAWRAARH